MDLWTLWMNEEQPDWMRTSGEGAFCFVSVRFQDVCSGVCPAILHALDPDASVLCPGPHALVLLQLCFFSLVNESLRPWGWTRQSPWHPLIQEPRTLEFSVQLTPSLLVRLVPVLAYLLKCFLLLLLPLLCVVLTWGVTTGSFLWGVWTKLAPVGCVFTHAVRCPSQGWSWRWKERQPSTAITIHLLLVAHENSSPHLCSGMSLMTSKLPHLSLCFCFLWVLLHAALLTPLKPRKLYYQYLYGVHVLNVSINLDSSLCLRCPLHPCVLPIKNCF